jgi:hypothetical protein
MLRHDFAPPVRLISFLCLALTLATAVQASLGDRQPEFKSCVAVSSTQLETAVGNVGLRAIVLIANA